MNQPCVDNPKREKQLLYMSIQEGTPGRGKEKARMEKISSLMGWIL